MTLSPWHCIESPKWTFVEKDRTMSFPSSFPPFSSPLLCLTSQQVGIGSSAEKRWLGSPKLFVYHCHATEANVCPTTKGKNEWSWVVTIQAITNLVNSSNCNFGGPVIYHSAGKVFNFVYNILLHFPITRWRFQMSSSISQKCPQCPNPIENNQQKAPRTWSV